MPCNCDHLEPTYHEAESKNVAQLIVFVRKSLNQTIPRWIKLAANNTYGDPDQVHVLTAKLCELCRNMTDDQQNKLIYNGRNSTSRRLADWWEIHQKADEERVAEEKSAEKKKKLAEKAKSKLTTEEFEALKNSL